MTRNTHHNNGVGTGGLLGTALLRTENAEREEVTINALLDGGSDITLIREGLARKLGLRGVSEEVAITTVGGGKMIASKKVKVVVTTREEKE